MELFCKLARIISLYAMKIISSITSGSFLGDKNVFGNHEVRFRTSYHHVKFILVPHRFYYQCHWYLLVKGIIQMNHNRTNYSMQQHRYMYVCICACVCV